jgi:hypothetical protein
MIRVLFGRNNCLESRFREAKRLESYYSQFLEVSESLVALARPFLLVHTFLIRAFYELRYACCLTGSEKKHG